MDDLLPSPFDRKRRADWLPCPDEPADKKSRPTTVHSQSEDRLWYPRDSVIGGSQLVFKDQPKYDSDDQSSLVSEPGSPQALSQVSEEDVSMNSDDEDARFVQKADRNWRTQLQGERAGTPLLSPKRGGVPSSHVRSRHPQENISSDKAEVPSPIDEDEVPTPPSAAEAAGSQLELLSVSDIEMATDDAVPTISVHTERSLQLDGHMDADRMDESQDGTYLRKGRARSGALSGGGSPMRESPGLDVFGKKFSMGFRADCEKCVQRVPGHMNHFY